MNKQSYLISWPNAANIQWASVDIELAVTCLNVIYLSYVISPLKNTEYRFDMYGFSFITIRSGTEREK